MDDEGLCYNEQCKFNTKNLKRQLKMMEDEWLLYEEKCHALQNHLTELDIKLKRTITENDMLRDQEKTLSYSLEIAEDKRSFLEIRLTDVGGDRDRMTAVIADLQEQLFVLDSEKLEMTKSIEDLQKRERDLQIAYDTVKSEHERLIELLAGIKCSSDALREERNMLSETVREMRQQEKEREKAAQELMYQNLLTPNNLFNEMSAVRSDLGSDESPLAAFGRRLNFTQETQVKETHCDCSQPSSLQSEFLQSDNEKLREDMKAKDEMVKTLQKKVLLFKAQKRRSRMKTLGKSGLRGDSESVESHAEDCVVTVIVKDGVQTGQPRVQVVDTVSIATQTDRIAILAAAVQTNGLGLDMSLPSESDEDSDSDSSSGSYAGFADDRVSPSEVDIYRSCRKLSVLMEEEGDECGLHRNSSIRSNLSARLCTSADDVLASIREPPLRTGKVVSCADIMLLSKRPPSIAFSECVEIPKSELESPSNASLLDPADAFRQPHSFDSYLDPQQIPSSLSRQISDPTTQNTACTPPIIRRGSYVKRPRSTCRPLTLTCDSSDNSVEERVPKVRFDLTEKDADVTSPPKETVLISKLKPPRNFSRFRVEPVDENQLFLEQNELRVRPHLHSVVYKKSVLHDISPDSVPLTAAPLVVVPDDPTPPEESLYDSFGEGSYLLDDIYPCKRRKESNVSAVSIESEGDIVTKSVRLHVTGECIVMRDLSGDTSSDTDIPYIDAEELAEILEMSKNAQTDISCTDTVSYLSPMGSYEEDVSSPTNSSIEPGAITSSPSVSSSGTFCTAVTELTPVKEELPKGGLSKSPTVLKNLASFESYDSPDVKHRILPKNVLEEDEEMSEESDTITYVTVKSDPLALTSDCESDTYVTVRSEVYTCSEEDSDTYVTLKSFRSPCLERKPSDLSDRSNSPYNTPPDTSSASFCTPPDNFSPLFIKSKKYLRMHSGSSTPSPRDTRSSSPAAAIARAFRQAPQSNSSSFNYDTPPSSSPFASPSKALQSNNEFANDHSPDRRRSSEATFTSSAVIFDSPKLEFYETNDSVENLEAFLESEEGLQAEDVPIKRNSLDSATDSRFGERRMKRHPPLSRQNSTEEYIYLEPQDSSLNLSEEISSPSTTPDTSNKTVIFKNKPLTVSNTIDLDDDDFPISESEIIINLNGSQSEIVEIPLMHTCRSEPCIPSMGKSALSRLSRQSCSMSEEPDCGANYPAIVISAVSSESETSSCRGRDDHRDSLPEDIEISVFDVSDPCQSRIIDISTSCQSRVPEAPSSCQPRSVDAFASCQARPPHPLPEASDVCYC